MNLGFRPFYLLAAVLAVVLVPLWVAVLAGGSGLVTVSEGAGAAVLVAGLVLQGHDGKMSTYMVLVLVAATVEWAMHRGWTRK